MRKSLPRSCAVKALLARHREVLHETPTIQPPTKPCGNCTVTRPPIWSRLFHTWGPASRRSVVTTRVTPRMQKGLERGELNHSRSLTRGGGPFNVAQGSTSRGPHVLRHFRGLSEAGAVRGIPCSCQASQADLGHD